MHLRLDYMGHVEQNVVVKSGKMAEAAFSEDGNYFSSITQDGRLRIWDTETNVLKQEYTPDLHLSSPPSCLQWISVAQSVSPQKSGRRRSVSGEQESQCIALGTSSGKILIYSVAQAKVETVLEVKNNEIHRNNVTSLDWHKKYGLYSCNKENMVYEWDLQSAGVRNKYNVNVDSKNKQANSISAIKIIPHNQRTPARYLITASTQLRVWSLHNDAEVLKCLGHNAASKALLTLATLNNTCWLVEGSQNERLLSFWDVTITADLVPVVNGEDSTPNRKKRKKSISSPTTVSTPTYNFVLEDAPRHIDVNVRNEDSGVRLRLSAVTRSGVAHYYEHLLNGASTKPIKPSVTIQTTTPNAQPLPLQCCHLPTTDVILGYNIGTKLVFEKVTPDLKTKTQILIRGEGTTGKERRRSNKQTETKVVSVGTNDVTYVEPLGGVTRKRVQGAQASVEVPMEQRLANLTVDLKSRAQAPVSHNLTRLLMQGLHSNDKRLILTVLQRQKAKVARNTVAGLPAQYVPMLLTQLADLATSRTSQCASVCTWLSAVLHCQSALLLATINSPAAHHLTHLLAIFMQRRSHLCQLLNLKGRLELTMSQREARQEDDIPQQPILEYNDSSSESDMEVERAPSSEHSWADSDAQLASDDENGDERLDDDDESAHSDGD